MKLIKRLFFLANFFSAQLMMSETVNETVKHVGRQKQTGFFEFLFQPKFILMLAIGIFALLLLKTNKMKKSIKVPLLLLSTFLFGFAGNIPVSFFNSFAMHPSPMCAATKPLIYGFGIPFIVTLAVIFFLTLLGPKLFCSYVCPVGAIQELIAMLADKLKIKRRNINFTIANTIRLGIFLLFLFISVTAILYIIYNGKKYPNSLYNYVNAFHGLELEIQKTLWDYIIHYLPFLLTVVLSFKYYRPFCHFVCPLGIYTHLLEQVSLFRISLKKKECTDCQICVEESPCTAIPDILKGSYLRPDCYGCNVCIEVCPEKILSVGIKRIKE